MESGFTWVSIPGGIIIVVASILALAFAIITYVKWDMAQQLKPLIQQTQDTGITPSIGPPITIMILCTILQFLLSIFYFSYKASFYIVLTQISILLYSIIAYNLNLVSFEQFLLSIDARWYEYYGCNMSLAVERAVIDRFDAQIDSIIYHKTKKCIIQPSTDLDSDNKQKELKETKTSKKNEQLNENIVKHDDTFVISPHQSPIIPNITQNIKEEITAHIVQELRTQMNEIIPQKTPKILEKIPSEQPPQILSPVKQQKSMEFLSIDDLYKQFNIPSIFSENKNKPDIQSKMKKISPPLTNSSLLPFMQSLTTQNPSYTPHKTLTINHNVITLSKQSPYHTSTLSPPHHTTQSNPFRFHHGYEIIEKFPENDTTFTKTIPNDAIQRIYEIFVITTTPPLSESSQQPTESVISIDHAQNTLNIIKKGNVEIIPINSLVSRVRKAFLKHLMKINQSSNITDDNHINNKDSTTIDTQSKISENQIQNINSFSSSTVLSPLINHQKSKNSENSENSAQQSLLPNNNAMLQKQILNINTPFLLQLQPDLMISLLYTNTSTFSLQTQQSFENNIIVTAYDYNTDIDNDLMAIDDITTISTTPHFFLTNNHTITPQILHLFSQFLSASTTLTYSSSINHFIAIIQILYHVQDIYKMTVPSPNVISQLQSLLALMQIITLKPKISQQNENKQKSIENSGRLLPPPPIAIDVNLIPLQFYSFLLTPFYRVQFLTILYNSIMSATQCNIPLSYDTYTYISSTMHLLLLSPPPHLSQHHGEHSYQLSSSPHQTEPRFSPANKTISVFFYESSTTSTLQTPSTLSDPFTIPQTPTLPTATPTFRPILPQTLTHPTRPSHQHQQQSNVPKSPSNISFTMLPKLYTLRSTRIGSLHQYFSIANTYTPASIAFFDPDLSDSTQNNTFHDLLSILITKLITQQHSTLVDEDMHYDPIPPSSLAPFQIFTQTTLVHEWLATRTLLVQIFSQLATMFLTQVITGFHNNIYLLCDTIISQQQQQQPSLQSRPIIKNKHVDAQHQAHYISLYQQLLQQFHSLSLLCDWLGIENGNIQHNYYQFYHHIHDSLNSGLEIPATTSTTTIKPSNISPSMYTPFPLVVSPTKHSQNMVATAIAKSHSPTHQMLPTFMQIAAHPQLAAYNTSTTNTMSQISNASTTAVLPQFSSAPLHTPASFFELSFNLLHNTTGAVTPVVKQIVKKTIDLIHFVQHDSFFITQLMFLRDNDRDDNISGLLICDDNNSNQTEQQVERYSFLNVLKSLETLSNLLDNDST